MTARRKDVDRKVVPRFHSLAAAAKQGETGSAGTKHRTLEADQPKARSLGLEELRSDWEQHRSPSFAADLVAAALVVGSPEEARDAAEFLLTSNPTALGEHVAQRLLGQVSLDEEKDFDPLRREEVRAKIRELKRSLRSDPRAGLFWAELARRYAALGQKHKAAEAMDIALALAPRNRFMLRSAARLNLHLEKPERGHNLLSSASTTQSDPWLLAAEIAMAPLAGRRSRLIKHGKRLLESGQFRLHALSELKSALATEAFAAGSDRDARRLFRSSLDEPTENAVAQAAWAARRGSRVEVGGQLLNDVQDSYEARAQVLAEEGDSDAAILNAWEWFRSESFASNPAIFGSHEAALARRYDEAARFAELGLIANPNEFLLRNNLAFALASAGRVEAAAEQLGMIEPSTLNEEQLQVLTATRGLVAFREGDLTLGRQLYKETIETAKDPALRAIAAILLTREEIRAETPAGLIAQRLAAELVAAAQRTADARSERVPAWVAHLEAESGGEVVIEVDNLMARPVT